MRSNDSNLPFLHLKAKLGDVQKVKPSRGVFRKCIELQRGQNTNMNFGLNFQPLTDTDSDVQKLKPKHLIDNHAVNSA